MAGVWRDGAGGRLKCDRARPGGAQVDLGETKYCCRCVSTGSSMPASKLCPASAEPAPPPVTPSEADHVLSLDGSGASRLAEGVFGFDDQNSVSVKINIAAANSEPNSYLYLEVMTMTNYQGPVLFPGPTPTATPAAQLPQNATNHTAPASRQSIGPRAAAVVQERAAGTSASRRPDSTSSRSKRHAAPGQRDARDVTGDDDARQPARHSSWVQVASKLTQLPRILAPQPWDRDFFLYYVEAGADGDLDGTRLWPEASAGESGHNLVRSAAAGALAAGGSLGLAPSFSLALAADGTEVREKRQDGRLMWSRVRGRGKGRTLDVHREGAAGAGAGAGVGVGVVPGAEAASDAWGRRQILPPELTGSLWGQDSSWPGGVVEWYVQSRQRPSADPTRPYYLFHREGNGSVSVPSGLRDSVFFLDLRQKFEGAQLQAVASVRAQLKTVVSLQIDHSTVVEARRREIVYTSLDTSRLLKNVVAQDASLMGVFLVFLKVTRPLEAGMTVRVWVNIDAQATETNYYKSVSGLSEQVFSHKESSFYLSALITSTANLPYVSWTLLADAAASWEVEPELVHAIMLDKDRVEDVTVDANTRVALFTYQPSEPNGAGRLFVQVMPSRAQGGRLGYQTWEELQDSVYIIAVSTWEGSLRYWQVCRVCCIRTY